MYTAENKRRAIEREISWRKRVYPNRVLTGRMKQAEADYQIRIFEEILSDYAKLEQGERLI